MRIASLVLAVSVVAGTICGCATTPKGPSPAEEVTAVMAEFIAAMKAKDVDKIVAFFSDDYDNDQGGTKSVLHDFFQGLVDQGVYDNIEVSLENSEIVVEGDTVSLGPVDYETPAGGSSYEYEFTKEADGVWRITYSGQI